MDKFCPTLEDVVLTGLPLFGERRTITLPEGIVEIALDEEGKRKLEAFEKISVRLQILQEDQVLTRGRGILSSAQGQD